MKTENGNARAVQSSIMIYHEPVLLKESVSALITDVNGIYIDATYGGGGHSKEILKHLKSGRVIAFDRDEDALANDIEDNRFMLIKSSFSYMKNFLKQLHINTVQGVLADLGISSHQIDTPERGFSTRFDAPLDMRMNRHASLTAEQVINEYEEDKLVQLFSDYGELRNARTIAARITASRSINPVKTTGELMRLLDREAGSENRNRFFAQVFQAIRIEVNSELDALKEFLLQCRDLIAPGGRLVVISYHSLEDRLVKNFFSAGTFTGEAERDVLYGHAKSKIFKSLYKKPVEAGTEETAANPRSRSARLRAGEKM